MDTLLGIICFIAGILFIRHGYLNGWKKAKDREATTGQRTTDASGFALMVFIGVMLILLSFFGIYWSVQPDEMQEMSKHVNFK